jgi:UDP-N-acetylmuramoylalanine--D-glutamate ligase
LTKVTRRKQVEDFKCVLGQAARDLVVKPGDFDLVIISPGLDEHWPLPKKFTDAGVPLVGETEFAFGLTDMPWPPSPARMARAPAPS